MNENEHPKVGQTIDRGWLNRNMHSLRPGTILKGDWAEAPPVVVMDEGECRVNGHVIEVSELHGTQFLVLWAPPSPPPKIDEKLTLEQLEALPIKAVVLDSSGYAYQADYRDENHQGQLFTNWSAKDFSGDEHALWQHAGGKLTLLWLPEQGEKG